MRTTNSEVVAGGGAAAAINEPNHTNRLVTYEMAQAIIATHNAFAKNIESDRPSKEPIQWTDPHHHWAFLIRQIKDPENFRPVKRIPTNIPGYFFEGADRTKLYNTVTGKWVNFQTWYEGYEKQPNESQWETMCVRSKKGLPRPGATHTKKTSVTLLPPDGRINLFASNKSITLILDLNKCKVKPQYIWDHNVASRFKWWYRGANDNPAAARVRLQRATTLDAIRQQQEKKINSRQQSNGVLNWNECQVDLCADAVIGVGIPQNNLTTRLDAQYRHLLILRELGISVPLIILTPEANFSEYTIEQQHNDLLNPVTNADREFAEVITKLKRQNSVTLYKNIIIESAKAKKWETVFSSLSVFISLSVACNFDRQQLVNELLPIVMTQGSIEVMQSLISIERRYVEEMGEHDRDALLSIFHNTGNVIRQKNKLEEEEEESRDKLSTEALFTLSQLQAPNEEKIIKNKIFALLQLIAIQIKQLEEEIKPKQIEIGRFQFSLPQMGSDNKLAKKTMLEEAKSLLEQQLHAGRVVNRTALYDFYIKSRSPSEWSAGRQSRTAPLINAARHMLTMNCAKTAVEAVDDNHLNLLVKHRIIELIQSIANQIKQLQEEIKQPIQIYIDHHTYLEFSRMDATKKLKSAKKAVLEQAKKLLKKQLNAGGAVDQNDLNEFDNTLQSKPEWSSGRQSRTAPLIKAARHMMTMNCAKPTVAAVDNHQQVAGGGASAS